MTMETMEAELILDAKATLGEGPCWDEDQQILYWVDIEERKVHSYDPKTKQDRFWRVSERPGTVVIDGSGRPVVAMKDAFCRLDPESGQTELLVRVDREPQGNRFNDGKCDAAGRFWAGTMPIQGSQPSGSLYCLEADGKLRHLFGDVRCSNGLAWSPDNRMMYYIDTPTKQVAAFDFDFASGEMKNKRIAVTIPDGEGGPDGMTIDDEGMLWVAQWGGYRVSRYNPHTGERLAVVKVPVERVTSCAFGGPKLDELYITTASVGLDEKGRAEQPLAGGIFKIKPGVSGAASHKFGQA